MPENDPPHPGQDLPAPAENRSRQEGTARLPGRSGEKRPDCVGMPLTEVAYSSTGPLADTVVIPGFEILELLGAGSFGRVWKARDQATGKIVAIKVFPPGAGERWQAVLEEVQHLARLDGVHGIVDLKQVVLHAAEPYYVMGFADGGSLAARLQKGPVPAAEAVNLFTQACEALAYVHAKGICHGDLKPGNILLDARGRALLADFGQAHLARAGGPTLGTFFYMPPEQANAAEALPDLRWDVYGLGAVLYALLTGEPPRFNAQVEDELQARTDLDNRLSRYRAWLTAAAPPAEHRRTSGVDADLAGILDRCLDIDPVRRPADARAVLTLLRQRVRRRRRRPLLWVALTASLLALAMTTLFGAQSKNVALTAYESQLAQQQLHSNKASASIVAQAVQEQLLRRVHHVQTTATAELTQALTRDDRPAMKRLLGRLMSRDGEPSDDFAEATVSNARGEVAAIVHWDADRRKLLSDDLGKQPFRQFSWRDWFSGTGDHYEEINIPRPPIRETHISDPYVSSKGRDNLFISISTPLGEPGKPPVGVLEAAVRLEDLNRWLRQARVGAHGFAVLLDRRRYCVLHDSPSFRPQFGKRPKRFLSPEKESELFPDDMGVIDRYHDPLVNSVFLAGYARMSDPRIGWIALVQHDRNQMLAPTAALRSQLDWIGLQSFLMVAGVTGFLWGWLFWLLRRSERQAEGWQSV